MRKLGSETHFEGKIFSVEVRRYADADGGEYERQVAVHPGAVAIVAHDERFVYLVSQPREAVGEEAVLEIPAGTMDVEGESELDCARRELDEEIGMRAERWEELRAFFPSPGWAQETTTIFLATGLAPSDGVPDEDERIEVVRWPLDQLDRAIAEVRDAKTLIGLLLLRERLLD
jgi:ADP-ribose pyrophosphatase